MLDHLKAIFEILEVFEHHPPWLQAIAGCALLVVLGRSWQIMQRKTANRGKQLAKTAGAGTAVIVALYLVPHETRADHSGSKVTIDQHASNGSSNIVVTGSGNSVLVQPNAQDNDTQHKLDRLAASVAALEHLEEDARFSNRDGLSLVIIGVFHKSDQRQRKYIFDSSTYSLYFDADNVLQFVARSKSGQEYPVSVRLQPSETFAFEELVLLVCEAASDHESSFLRVSVNGRIVARSRFDADLGFPKKPPSFTLGAQANGTNGAAFSLVHIVTASGSLSKGILETLKGQLGPKPPIQVIEFDGRTWLSTDAKGSLSQEVEAFQPKHGFLGGI